MPPVGPAYPVFGTGATEWLVRMTPISTATVCPDSVQWSLALLGACHCSARLSAPSSYVQPQ